MAINFLVMLIRHDHPLPTAVVRLHTQNLIHDTLTIRKVGVMLSVMMNVRLSYSLT